MIDLSFIESLIKALDESSLDSLELERGGTRVRLSKSPCSASGAPQGFGQSPSSQPVALQANGLESLPALPASEGGVVPSPDDVGEELSGLVEVTSPMVGTFYSAPAPDADPYVEIGQRIGEGTVLCIIEAMKLMNELESEVTGTIAKIMVENAQPVEYGQVLFLVDPA
jgi:acetyl-CoA carboxylase biotin carboxyl carrier protein